MGVRNGPERNPVARSDQDSEENPSNDIAQDGCEQDAADQSSHQTDQGASPISGPRRSAGPVTELCR